MTKEDVFSNSGVWVRWLISVILGLGSVGTGLFYLGRWTQNVNSQIIALVKQDDSTSERIKKIEDSGSAPLQMRVMSLEKDYGTIMLSLADNTKAHEKILLKLEALNIQRIK